jgi:hypothetical protein
MLLKKPMYDISGYTISITSKITAFANPDQIVIGQLVYESLDKSEKSIFRELRIDTEVWDYVSNTTGGGNLQNIWKYLREGIRYRKIKKVDKYMDYCRKMSVPDGSTNNKITLTFKE